MDVNEIFYSIEGEGVRAGMPCVFVRFNGCNLNCNYCDTPYAHEPSSDKSNMTVSEVINSISMYGCPNVTLTGGEPLLQDDLNDLVERLANLGYSVNIETNGSINPYTFSSMHSGNIIVTIDYKCKSSGVPRYNNLDNFLSLYNTDVLKFVVGTVDDMEEAFTIINALKHRDVRPKIYFSPVFGKIEPADIAEFLKSHGLYNCKVQIQLHKILWDPNKRGV